MLELLRDFITEYLDTKSLFLVVMMTVCFFYLLFYCIKKELERVPSLLIIFRLKSKAMCLMKISIRCLAHSLCIMVFEVFVGISKMPPYVQVSCKQLLVLLTKTAVVCHLHVDSKLSLGVSVHGCVWPCDELATCRLCTFPPAQWQLGQAPDPPANP